MTTPPALTDRAPAPDLARGALLLLIAVANVHLFLFGHEVGVRGYAADPDPAERVLAFVQVMAVDGRAYPLFGLLLGYGMARLVQRGGATLVRRRARWMVALGLVHAALLFSGDVVGAYGLLGLLLAGRIGRASDRGLLRAAGIWLVGTALAGAVMAAPVPPGQRALLVSMTVAEPLPAVAVRVAEWVAVGLLQAAGVGAAVLIGAWAARRRLLDEPAARPLLRVVAVGLPVSLLGAVPLATQAAGFWDPPLAVRLVTGSVHAVSGYGGGLACAALAGLVAIRCTGRIGFALVACGQRSLSCYLAQSVVFVAVLAPYGGGLGDRVGLVGAAAIAIAAWAATVVAAGAAARRGLRGPAEIWLRRRTYRISSSRV